MSKTNTEVDITKVRIAVVAVCLALAIVMAFAMFTTQNDPYLHRGYEGRHGSAVPLHQVLDDPGSIIPRSVRGEIL